MMMTARPTNDRWCILRAAGSRTLPLARSLAAAGFDVWTPVRTIRRLKPGRSARSDGKQPLVDVDVAILPTFVFARAGHLHALAVAAAQPISSFPDFSVFRHGGRIPLVSGAQIVGLQEAEREAMAAMQALRDADALEAVRLARIAMLKTERAQRKALRSQRRDLPVGMAVRVADMPALTGKSGIVQRSDGTSALVAFGGALAMTIEAWRLSPFDVDDAASATPDRADAVS